MKIKNPKLFNRSGMRYLALLIKDNAVPIDECFCQFASIEALAEGLESVTISKDAFLEVAAYLLGEFLDAPARFKLFEVMDIDCDGVLGIHDWRQALASAQYWMSEDGKSASAAIRIQSAWRGHFERGALLPASGMFTIETVFQPMENQKYWEDEDEEIFCNHVPVTVIDDSFSAHDVLSALTALAQSKGFTPHSLFVYICKSSAFEPDKAFVLNDFIESFVDLCGDELTDQLHQVLSQAFNQLMDLNSDGKVSSTEFFWVMQQYFETRHGATWIEAEPTRTNDNVLEVTRELDSRTTGKFASASIENPSDTMKISKNAAGRTQNASSIQSQGAAAINANDSSKANHSSTHVDMSLSTSNVQTVSCIQLAEAAEKAVDLKKSSEAAAAIQLAEAAEKAADLKKSSEAAAAIQLAEAASIKLAAEKLFAEAVDIKKSSEVAAARQIAEASAIKQAAEAAAKLSASNTSAVFTSDSAVLQIAPSKRPVQIGGATLSDKSTTEESFAKLTKSVEIPFLTSHDESCLTPTSVGSASTSSSTSKYLAFDPRKLAQSHDNTIAGANIRDLNSILALQQIPRPASSGDLHTPKTVRFASTRPQTSDGSSSGSGRSAISNSDAPVPSYAAHSHQSRQPNSQQTTAMKMQDAAFPQSSRAHDKLPTSFIGSMENGPAMPHKQKLPNKTTSSDFTKRVLLVDVENSCTWIRACAEKIGSR
jgi:hypothetical protein